MTTTKARSRRSRARRPANGAAPAPPPAPPIEQRVVSELDVPASDLFDATDHPVGMMEMNCWRGVHAEGETTTFATSRPEPGWSEADHQAFLDSRIELTIARNVAGNPDLFLEIKARGTSIEWSTGSTEGLHVQLRTPPEALVTLATLLPRLVEMARREGLLKRSNGDGQG